MHRFHFFPILITKLIIYIIVVACQKNKVPLTSLASLNVANAVIDGAAVKLNTNTRDSAVINDAFKFGLTAGTQTTINLFPVTNPSSSYFNEVKALDNGGIYSLFLTGNATAPESVFVQDEIPPFSNDSIIRVRVINLSPNSENLSITLESSPTITEYTGLNYKALTDFKTYPLPTIIPEGSTVFQVRDGDDIVQASYTLPSAGSISVQSSRFRNITLVVKGLIGTATGNNAFGVYAMSNY